MSGFRGYLYLPIIARLLPAFRAILITTSKNQLCFLLARGVTDPCSSTEVLACAVALGRSRNGRRRQQGNYLETCVTFPLMLFVSMLMLIIISNYC